MEKDRYILLSKDETIKALFEEVFEGGVRVFGDLKSMQEYVTASGVDDGAIFFEYGPTREEVDEIGLEKKELLEFSHKHFFKVICLYHGVNPELSPEVMEHLYDFIDMDESPFIISKKLKNMRKSLLLELVINDVLDMSSFEGRNKMSRERFNLFKMVSYIASVTYQKCVDKGITYELNIQKDVPEFLIGDRIRLNQVFLNLMTGTVQKSPEGCTVSFNIESEKIDDKTIRLKFVVEGKGFTINSQSRMVDMSHGTIEVETLPDDITRITIIFNAEYDNDVEIDTAKAAERFVNMRVAVIGRNSKVRLHTTDILEQLGFTTECFNTLADFKQVFKQRNLTGNLYSVCMIDGELENDEDIVREVRALPGMSSAMVIVNTYNPDHLRMEYLRAGANAVVGKPISRTQIYNTMMQIAGRKISVVRKAIKSGFTFIGKRVLVVDDNELSLEIARDIIKQSGAIAEIAHDGAEGLFKFNTSGVGSYDLVLLDIQMPNMDGCDVAREIRASKRADANIPIIALTSVKDDATHERAHKAGMNDVILKPLDIKELMGVMNGIYN